MTEAVIVATARSPIGRANKGSLVSLRPDDMTRLSLEALVPVTAAVLGYIPGKFGLGEDMPAGVVTEWARWCHTPGYATGAVPDLSLTDNALLTAARGQQLVTGGFVRFGRARAFAEAQEVSAEYGRFLEAVE